MLVLPVSRNNSRAAAVASSAGRELFNAGLFKESVAQFEKACLLDPSNASKVEACCQAMLMLEQGAGEARGKLMRAKTLAPFSAFSNVLQCRLAMKKAKVEEVGPHTDQNLMRELLVGYNEAFKLEPERFCAAERRDELLRFLGDKGPPAFGSGVSEEVAALRQKGVGFMGKKKWPDAFRALNECVQREPQNPRNLVLRSLVLSKCKARGNPAEVALRDAKMALRLHHGLADAWLALAVAYARLGDVDWALEAVEEGERQDPRATERYADEVGKIRATALKRKAAARRPEPWQYSESEAVAMAGTARCEPVLEMDSLGEMTIRSQFKRVMMGHQVRAADVALMAGEQRPVHVAQSDIRDGALARPKSPRSEAVVSPRHALRPTAKQAAKGAAPPKKDYDETLRGEVGEDAAQ